jgi:hypothetical protein
MAGSPGAGLDAGAVGEWCARAFAGALEVAGRLPSGPGRPRGEYAERALALRMRALVQQVPPYRALRGLQAVAADGWADAVALRGTRHTRSWCRLSWARRRTCGLPLTGGWIPPRGAARRVHPARPPACRGLVRRRRPSPGCLTVSGAISPRTRPSGRSEARSRRGTGAGLPDAGPVRGGRGAGAGRHG